MLKILLYCFIFYIVYKFIVDFAMPVGKASKEMRQKLEEMQRQQQEAARQQQQASARQEQAARKPSVGEDYIEFEEVKK